MTIKKKKDIKYKVLKARNVIKLAKYFIQVNNEMRSEPSSIQFTIDFMDGLTINGDNLSIFDDIETRKVEEIQLHLFEASFYQDRQTMLVNVTNFLGYFQVESEEKDWVDAKFSQLEELVNEIPNQPYILSNTISQFFISYGVGSFLVTVTYIYLIVNILGKEAHNIFLVIYITVLGLSITHLVLGQLVYKLYPKIEFDTVIDDLNENKKKKGIIKSIVTLILIPVLVTFIGNLIFK